MSMPEQTPPTATEPALPGMPESMPARPRWSAAEAARRCGVGRATIQRALEDGRITGAEKTDDGWQIPVESLLAAGFKPTAAPAQSDPVPEDDREPDRADNEGARVTELQAQIYALTANLDHERARRAAAEQRAEHAQQLATDRAQHIDHLAQAMRLIEARTPTAPDTPQEVTEQTTEHPTGEWHAYVPVTDTERKPSKLRRWLSGT